MGKHRKRWTSSEKSAVLSYYKLWGAVKASREYSISVTSIYKWKDALEQEGAGLSPAQDGKVAHQELKRLKRENDELKKIVAEKELRLRIQEEMLKKSH